MKKKNDTISCKQCLHYEGCLNRFRKRKEDGCYELIDEEEYFAHSDDCDFLITQRDVVEVVRCRDCKFRETDGCPRMFWDNNDNDFCSNGKRREEK